jgi:hypothetical protein
MPKGPNGQTRPADVIGNAVHIARIATGEIEDTKLKQPAKRASGLAGAKARHAAVSEEKRIEIDRNFRAMAKRINQYTPLHAHKFALMRNGEVIEFYSRFEDAFRTGKRFYPDDMFSIQQVTKTPVDLGFFSHAVHLG